MYNIWHIYWNINFNIYNKYIKYNINFKLYNKLTIWAKILILISLFLICFSIFSVKQEGFKNNKTFTFAEGPIVYDNFYSTIYDTLVYNKIKNDIFINHL